MEKIVKLTWTKAETLIMKAWKQDRINAGVTVMKYEDKYGADGIFDLLGWEKWCKDNLVNDGNMLANVGHDLGGIFDEFLCPRTSGYSKFLQS